MVWQTHHMVRPTHHAVQQTQPPLQLSLHSRGQKTFFQKMVLYPKNLKIFLSLSRGGVRPQSDRNHFFSFFWKPSLTNSLFGLWYVWLGDHYNFKTPIGITGYGQHRLSCLMQYNYEPNTYKHKKYVVMTKWHVLAAMNWIRCKWVDFIGDIMNVKLSS